ncbi:MAG: Omp28-related outer membrane protein [Candidatus Cryptobacteroides sp.]
MKFKTFAYAAASFMAAVACSGNYDPNAGEYDDGKIVAPYYISVDKPTIEADGIDAATFKVVDSKGHDLMTDDNLGYLYFMNVKTEKRLDRNTTSFSAFENGEYEFVGIYRGTKTENTVKIKAQNREKYELYHKNIGIYDITSVNCSNCPTMVANLAALPAEQKDHIVVLACHSYYQGEDPFALTLGASDLGNTLLSRFKGTGYPSAVFALEKLQSGPASSLLIDNINEQRLNHPASVGIKINNTYNASTGVLTINATAKASAAGKYQFGYAVMADNVYYPDGSSVDGIYNDVVVTCSGTILGFYGDDYLTGEEDKLLRAQELADGEEMNREFNITLNIGSASSYFKNATYKVAVFVIKNTGTSYYMDNIAECAMDSSVDYRYN